MARRVSGWCDTRRRALMAWMGFLDSGLDGRVPNLGHAKHWLLALGLLLLTALPAQAAPPQAPDSTGPAKPPQQVMPKLLRGLFEGHGVVPPKDSRRARAARRLAHRLAQTCLQPMRAAGGGGLVLARPCVSPAIAKHDDAAAILDELNDLRSWPVGPFPMDGDSWHALLEALAKTGRADVVPVLITALERLELRARYPEGLRVANEQDSPWDRFRVVVGCLQRLTYQDIDSPSSSAAKPSEFLEVVEAWRAWFAAHGEEARAEWRAKTLEQVRRAIRSGTLDERARAVDWLLRTAGTRAEGLREVAALKREHPERFSSAFLEVRASPPIRP